MRPNYIRAKTTDYKRRISIVVRPDNKDQQRWFIALPGASASLDYDEMLNLAKAIIGQLEDKKAA
ncbi:hypothetical protein CEQ06_09655 [Corynebacterium jeikeium]|nr:hypothetical protein CEQ06_09655 [Corynebacterium jeikeium]